ncbi:MAG: hypothetical protein HY438_03315 [DPANN group archaeon]|nr:hypothetical protein [DPANN group archaeon]
MAGIEQPKSAEQLRAEQVKKYNLQPNEYFFQVKEFARSEPGGFIYSGSKVTRLVIGQTVVVGADRKFYDAQKTLLPDQNWWGIRLDEANRDLQRKLEEDASKGVRVSS